MGARAGVSQQFGTDSHHLARCLQQAADLESELGSLNVFSIIGDRLVSWRPLIVHSAYLTCEKPKVRNAK